MTTKWQLSGTYFETCNCEAACPCVFLSPPTEGDCTALVAWHIARGRYGDVGLDGLNVALAVHAPGTMVETKWTAAAYLDDTADSEQDAALHAIFGGKAGGHPAVLGSFISKMLGAKSVPMRFRSEGREISLAIPGITEASVEMMEGQDGKPITIAGHPLAVAPGVPAQVGHSRHFHFADYDWQWQLSGRNAFVSPFTYASE